MKKLLSLMIFLLFFASNAYAQKLTENEKVEVRKALNSLFKVFESPTPEKFNEISVPNIYCSFCERKVVVNGAYQIRKEIFFKQHLNKIVESNLWRRVLNSEEIIFHKEPKHNHKFTEITVFYTTWKPGEYAPGHEGAQLGIGFKSVGNKYKFSSIETIP